MITGTPDRHWQAAILATSLAIGALAWEIAGQMELSFVFPPLSAVISTVVEVWGSSRFRDALWDTLYSLAIAYPISVGGGVLVGLVAGRYRLVEWIVDVYVNMFLSLPLIALIPIILLLFGLERTSLIVIVFIYTFFFVLVNTMSGVKAVEYRYEEMARSFGANEFRVLWRIIIPGALPLILTGVRIGTGRATKGVIIGEQLMGFVGMGALVQQYGNSFRVEETWAMILAIGLLGMIAIEFIRLMEGRILKLMPQGAMTAE